MASMVVRLDGVGLMRVERRAVAGTVVDSVVPRVIRVTDGAMGPRRDLISAQFSLRCPDLIRITRI